MRNKKLHRSNVDTMICGVCSGIAEYFEIDPSLVRLAWLIVTCLTGGAGVLAYIGAAIIIPN